MIIDFDIERVYENTFLGMIVDHIYVGNDT